jgi:hypothetical protein
MMLKLQLKRKTMILVRLEKSDKVLKSKCIVHNQLNA